jgi:hypothetical protein
MRFTFTLNVVDAVWSPYRVMFCGLPMLLLTCQVYAGPEDVSTLRMRTSTAAAASLPHSSTPAAAHQQQ